MPTQATSGPTKPASETNLVSSLNATLQGRSAESGCHPCAAASAVFALPDERSGVAVSVGVEQRVIGDVGARVNETLSVAGHGVHAGRQAQGLGEAERSACRCAAGFKEPALYEVPRGSIWIRGAIRCGVAAHSAMTGKTGSVYFDVVVPAYSKDALQLSGMTLSASPSLAGAPGEGFRRVAAGHHRPADAHLCRPISSAVSSGL
jgi:hypothetical protein